jgi:hypothetical protein
LNERIDTFVVRNAVGGFDALMEDIVPVAFSQWRSGEFLLAWKLFQLLVDADGLFVGLNWRRRFLIKILFWLELKTLPLYSWKNRKLNH